MAKLTVQAAPLRRPLSLNSIRTPLVVYLSVTDEAGRPVEGLKDSEFRITSLEGPVVGGEGGNLAVPPEVEDTSHQTGGFYRVQIQAGQGQPWEAGHYVLGLAVEDKKTGASLTTPATPRPRVDTDNGQTLLAWEIT